jgi:hypothetical protein
MIVFNNTEGEYFMKKIFFLVIFVVNVWGGDITPSDVYGEVMRIKKEVNYLLEYYHIDYDEKKMEKISAVHVNLKPRDVWQKSYEIMIKINILRSIYNLPSISPVNMAPVLNLNPDLVWEQTQRVLTEIKIFEYRDFIAIKNFQVKKYKNKTPLDVFNGFAYISTAMDKLNRSSFTPSYVFAQNMRVYDDLSLIISRLGIEDNTIPAKINPKATPNDTFKTGMKILAKIKQLQILAGIAFVDFSSISKGKATPSDVFSITQMIIAELQTLKAYLKIHSITIAAKEYESKTPVEVDQLMSWNLRKLNLVGNIVNAGRGE